MNFRNEKDLYLHIKNGGRIDRPLKEWERRGLLRKVQSLRAAAVEAENFAFRTSSDASARKAEKRAKLFRTEAKILESRLIAMGLYKKTRPQMESTMKITPKQLKRIIREALVTEGISLSDRLYLHNLMMSYQGTFKDWDGFCDWYDDLMQELRLSYDEDMLDFLIGFDMAFCPETPRELADKIDDEEIQSHPMFSVWADALIENF